MVTIGSTLAGYRIEGVAGRGGMGVVYRAHQLKPDRPVALKVVASELLDDPQFRERFERESSIAASIEHPHVIPVYEVGDADGVLFIAMRYVDGPDLRSLIRRGLSPEDSARIVDQLARALDAAHARGLVHRDVKPANVLVSQADKEPHAYLTDFGLTKHLGASAGPTRSGALVGTIDYIAPEQVRGEKVDARADVYSLACLLYECLTGRVPYPYEADVAKLWAHVNQGPPSLLAAGTRTAGRWEAVIERGMAKEPAERYPSAGDLGRAASAASAANLPSARERTVATGAAAPEPASGPTATVTSKAAAVAPADGGQTHPGRSLPPRSFRSRVARRRVAVSVATGLALLSGVVGLAVVVGEGRRARPAPSIGRLVGAPIPVGRALNAISAGEGAVWVASSRGDSVSKVDPRSRRVEGKRIGVGREPLRRIGR